MNTRDEYRFHSGSQGASMCPYCSGSELEDGGQVDRVFPPGQTYDLLVCGCDPNHRFLEIDGTLEPYNG